MLWITQGDNHSCFSMKYWETGDIYVWKIIKYTTICSYLVHVLLSMVVGGRRGEQKLLHPMNPQSQIIFLKYFLVHFFLKRNQARLFKVEKKKWFCHFWSIVYFTLKSFYFFIFFTVKSIFINALSDLSKWSQPKKWLSSLHLC